MTCNIDKLTSQMKDCNNLCPTSRRSQHVSAFELTKDPHQNQHHEGMMRHKSQAPTQTFWCLANCAGLDVCIFQILNNPHDCLRRQLSYDAQLLKLAEASTLKIKLHGHDHGQIEGGKYLLRDSGALPLGGLGGAHLSHLEHPAVESGNDCDAQACCNVHNHAPFQSTSHPAMQIATASDADSTCACVPSLAVSSGNTAQILQGHCCRAPL